MQWDTQQAAVLENLPGKMLPVSYTQRTMRLILFCPDYRVASLQVYRVEAEVPDSCISHPGVEPDTAALATTTSPAILGVPQQQYWGGWTPYMLDR